MWQRRYTELILQNPDITLEEVKTNLEKRDYIDSHREISPLRKAADAIVLDNTSLTMQEPVAIGFAMGKRKTKACDLKTDVILFLPVL